MVGRLLWEQEVVGSSPATPTIKSGSLRTSIYSITEFIMSKVKIKQRPLDNFGSASCGCCDRLSWKNLKYDKQALKEAVNDVDYELDVREGKAA